MVIEVLCILEFVSQLSISARLPENDLFVANMKKPLLVYRKGKQPLYF